MAGPWLFSFRCAARGAWLALSGQRNGRIHVLAALAAIALGAALGLTASEWCFVVAAVAAVFAAEAFNTAVEQLADALCPTHHAGIGRAKDMAAGGVLLTAAGAAAVGVFVFGSRMLALSA